MKPDIKKKLNASNPRKVTELQLQNGRLKKLPFEVKEFTRLKTLNLFNNNLTELPIFFKTLERVQSLILSNNKFTVFPENLESCKDLKYLSLKGNRVGSLIGITEHQESLEKIDLSSNKLDTLNVNLGSFIKLRDLDLSDNGIKKFPKSLSSTPLKKLNLASNSILTIPSSIRDFKQLRYLDLSYNNLNELPEEICELTELRSLDLTGNNISRLPKSFSKLKSLKELNLSGNKLDEVPIEIADQGLEAVLNYYLNLGESVELNEAKLLIVGQGAVGKTYLVNKMINGVSAEPETTEGIDIHKWFLEFENKGNSQKLRLNAWDFGGQEIYHSTHQFFLTKRSVYLFVWEARTDESLINFDYWLNIVRVLSNSSPVIVVLNKVDERIKQIDQKTIAKQFPNIKAFQAVSAKVGTNMESLIDTVKESVLELPHIHDKLPKVWNQIREKLESLSSDYITYEEYIAICYSFGLSKDQSKSLSRYFHDLGVYLHFEDSLLLKSVVFLKPEWATNCVYRIMDVPEIIRNYGMFDMNTIEHQLSEYSSIQISYIIELMKRFEICFELRKGEYVVPELLSPSELEVDWDQESSISMVYKYDFMPAGIIPRLTVRLKNDIYERKYWKNGVYLSHNDSFGRVIGNQFDRTIKIEVKGESKALLLGIIKRELDHINSTLNYPSHNIKIQCNCGGCKGSDNPFMFDYEYLMRVKQTQQKFVQCQYHIKDVNVQTLIGPYEISIEEKTENFRYNYKDLTFDVIEISSRILERKFTFKTEDLITDNFTDQLRSKGYRVTDQTRSGRSRTHSGELDIVVRNPRNMPISILEAMRLKSFGMGNKTIIEHLTKLLLNYDTNGLKRNFLLIYAQDKDFDSMWLNYQTYIEKLSHHFLYNPDINMISFAVNNELSQRSNIRTLISQHNINGEISEVYHIFVNLF
ncbi:COR domain-containing protein [Roseivirga pacifica]